MEEYPFLNEAVASVLRTQREEHDLSKKRLSELAKIERAYITSLERGEKRPTLNVQAIARWNSYTLREKR